MDAATKLVEIAQSNALMLLFLCEQELAPKFLEWQKEKLKNLLLCNQQVKTLQDEICGEIN